MNAHQTYAADGLLISTALLDDGWYETLALDDRYMDHDFAISKDREAAMRTHEDMVLRHGGPAES